MRLTFEEYPNITQRDCAQGTQYVAAIDKGTREGTRSILKKGNQDSWKQKKRKNNRKTLGGCHVGVDSVSASVDGSGEDDCAMPFLNPLTKLRNGRRSQSSAPEGGGIKFVLARVRGLISESSSSDSRARFLPAPSIVPSTAVASVEATDTGGRFSDFSERLGLPLEVPSACTAACPLSGELPHA